MTEISTLTADTDVAVSSILDALPVDQDATPEVRAQQRLRRLQASFAASLATVAEMYRDEDWKYLSRADGTPYASLAEVFSDVMSLSQSMARRYVQGARDFYLPLSEVIAEGTRIEITSGDVAALGSDGLKEAVDRARERLEGVDDPDEAGVIISDSIRGTKARRTSKSDDPWDDGDWDDGDGSSGAPSSGGGFDPRSSNSGGYNDFADDGPAPTRRGGDDEFADDLVDDLPAGNSTVEGDDDLLVDLTERVMRGATDYSDPEALAELPEPLRSFAAALQTLSEIDPHEMSRVIDYDTRGVLLPIGDVQTTLTRVRALVEAQPWFLARYGV
jgi:hypothetical protein